jgi:hypothetical protein
MTAAKVFRLTLHKKSLALNAKFSGAKSILIVAFRSSLSIQMFVRVQVGWFSRTAVYKEIHEDHRKSSNIEFGQKNHEKRHC